ncbi:uncharacterized protein SAPINGB_P001385 [Magnusiomyces paraingens]|uniref:Uncharacterized protein n=1 Tax=Magnusiomyces paraingens TaxID=2606893 RepID=A0A5E8B5G5_9ASCO|nr:uncharacterized protein SAPINGB_P001385 [Saprochaete ingens]VVT46784.1 unnamed protein product [Saprochaete ingens]
MPQHASTDFSLSLLKSSSAGRKRQALAEARKNNDHVFMALYQDRLSYKDMKALISALGLSNSPRAHDILMSYRILSTLEKYLEETDSWSFNMLSNYEFQKNVRQFDLDVAIVVGARSEHLLAEIYSWNIPKLKKTIMGFSTYSSDDATILTVLVFRILNNYSTLEFTLQLALSRATLIKIHHEMCSLFTKIPGADEDPLYDDPYHRRERARNESLVEAYRRFVTSLLSELESTPFESVQQELFQIVRDLRSMFYKFADSNTSKNLKSLEQQSNQTGQPPLSNSEPQTPLSPTPSSDPSLNIPKMTIPENLAANDINNNNNNSNTTKQPSAKNPTDIHPEPHFDNNYKQQKNNNNIPDPTASKKMDTPPLSDSSRSTLNSFFGSSIPTSTSSSFLSGSTTRAKKTSRRKTSGSSSSVVSSLSEELPNMLQAFELARRREEYFKQHQQQFSSPPGTPSTSTTSDHDPLKTPTSSTTSDNIFSPESSTTSYFTSPTQSSYGPELSSNSNSSSNPTSSSSSSTITHSTSMSSLHPPPPNANIKHQSPIAEAAVSSEQMVQVKMVNGRMMMKIENGQYVDMQEWADRANTVSEVNHQSATHPSYSIHMPSSPTHSHASLHTETGLKKKPQPSTEPKQPQRAVTATVTNDDLTKKPVAPHSVSTPDLASQIVVPSVTTIPSSVSTPSFGVASIFQPWLRSSYNAGATPVIPKDEVDNSLVVSKKSQKQIADKNQPQPMSTLDFLRQNAPGLGLSTIPESRSSQPQHPPPVLLKNDTSVFKQKQLPVAPSAASTPAINTSVVANGDKSWIKGMIGNAEMQFPKNYTNEMGF